jgi:hypothetical protein
MVTFLLFVLGATAAGVFWGAHRQLRAAERALERHDFDEAQQHLDQYLKVHFRSAPAYLLAARTARRRDAYDDADNYLASCLRLEGMTDEAAFERLLLAAQQGDFAEMEGLLKARTVRGDPEAALVLEALAKGYWSRYWTADAKACLNQLLELEPSHWEARLLRAQVLEDAVVKGEIEDEMDALHDYEEAAKRNPSFEARLGLARMLYRVGRPWDAASQFEQLQQSHADHAEVLLGLARCRFSLNEVDQARRLIDTVLEQHADNLGALLERGRLACHTDESEVAERCLRRAAAVAPLYDCEPSRLLCQFLESRHNDDEARSWRERLRNREAAVLGVHRKILHANRDPHDVGLRYEIAMELMNLGRDRDGVAALFLVLEQDPGHAPAHAALAEYFDRMREPARASRHRRAGANTGTR